MTLAAFILCVEGEDFRESIREIISVINAEFICIPSEIIIDNTQELAKFYWGSDCAVCMGYSEQHNGWMCGGKLIRDWDMRNLFREWFYDIPHLVGAWKGE